MILFYLGYFSKQIEAWSIKRGLNNSKIKKCVESIFGIKTHFTLLKNRYKIFSQAIRFPVIFGNFGKEKGDCGYVDKTEMSDSSSFMISNTISSFCLAI